MLPRSYLLKADGKVVERPQHMIMRVSVGIHKDDIAKVIETYDLMSQRLFTHATPTLFNAGTPKPQMSSCFLLTMKEDSINGIYDTLKQVRADFLLSCGFSWIYTKNPLKLYDFWAVPPFSIFFGTMLRIIVLYVCPFDCCQFYRIHRREVMLK